jgi:signal recognition particle subunit SRP54
MFERLQERLNEALRTLKGTGVIKEGHIEAAFREIRRALLEADVHFQVARAFLERVREKALGQRVFESLTPDQHLLMIVRDELKALLGTEAQDLALKGAPPHVILLVGVQGSGKTTTAAKLALHLKRKRLEPLLATTDVKRPAALEQLLTLAKALNVHVYPWGKRPKSPLALAEEAIDFLRTSRYDTLILDTQGRLHADEALMKELVQMKQRIQPKEVLLVADAMTGQDALKLAGTFHEAVGLTGIVLTKMDGDARGGGALSMREITGVPIKLIGTGERPSDLEVFHPERMASRILGMGDVLTLIERAKETFEEERTKQLEKKLRTKSFTLEDFRDQIRTMKKLGPLSGIMGMIPGFSKVASEIDSAKLEGRFKHVEAILNSMTRQERQRPEILNGSRRKRIASGSGTRVQEINQLLKQFEETKKLVGQLTGNRKGLRGLLSGMP